MLVNVKEMIDYLKGYPGDSEISILVVNSEERLVYQVKKIGAITDDEIPVVVVDIGESEPMEEG